MSHYLLFAIAVIVLFYIAAWLGVTMLMATMTEFAEYQNLAYQWPIWYEKAFRTLYNKSGIKKHRVLGLFLLHMNDAMVVSMAAMVPPSDTEYQNMSYEERIRIMYLSIQPKGEK